MQKGSEHLDDVAGAVADGTPVSWDEELRRAPDLESAATLSGLKDLEAILSAQRQLDRAYDAGLVPSHWRHLAIVERLGEGSFGTVYRAYDSQLAIDVALKLLFPSRRPATPPAQLLSEAQLLARIRHPNVVTVYGADQAEDCVGVWMELIKGRTLEQLLATHGTFGAQEAASIGRDLCRALAAVHHAGAVHGDIKAHNVMRQEGGRTVLMDFGAGHLAAVEPSRPASLTGTPLYLAPEVLEGESKSVASDIYALGVLLYHLVTGSYPVVGASAADVIAGHRQRQRRYLRDLRPDLPDDFVRIVERATSPDPRSRFASAGAFEAAFGESTTVEPGESASVPSQGSGQPASGRRKLMALLGAVVLIAAAAVWWTRAGAAGNSATYDVDAAFYRMGGAGEERLAPGSRVAPGDELLLKFQASVPLNLYVVNEDEKGEAFLLFPLPGQPLTNPLPANQPVVVPGGARWQVTSAGGREHFLIFASVDRLESFEQVFAGLPTAQLNAPVVSAPLPSSMVDRLRGVGGLKPDMQAQSTSAGLSRLFTTPLPSAPERVRGLWVRQVTLDNPAR